MVTSQVEKEIYDIIASLEEKTSKTLYLSPLALPLKSRVGSKYLGYYVFYEEKCLRFEYLNSELIGCSFWDTVSDLLEAEIRINLSDLDESDIVSSIVQFIEAIPEEDDNPEAVKEVTEFIDKTGEFIVNNGATYAYSSYEMWAESRNKNVLSKEDFISAFNKVVVQKKVGAISNLETGIMNEEIVITEKDEEKFRLEVRDNKDFYSYKYLVSMIKCMVDEDTSVNASFVCGKYVNEARDLIKDTLQEEGAWVTKTVWKEKTTSIYQFISTLWKYRSGFILIFNNVDNPIKNKDHNFYMLLDNLMKTENPNRVVSYSRKEKKNG